jgi:hypothetical protein
VSDPFSLDDFDVLILDGVPGRGLHVDVPLCH